MKTFVYDNIKENIGKLSVRKFYFRINFLERLKVEPPPPLNKNDLKLSHSTPTTPTLANLNIPQNPLPLSWKKSGSAHENIPYKSRVRFLQGTYVFFQKTNSPDTSMHAIYNVALIQCRTVGFASVLVCFASVFVDFVKEAVGFVLIWSVSYLVCF